MTLLTQKPLVIPWPGPKPYDIYDGTFFFGREAEIAEIRSLIFREYLTILSAESGAGKTSLLKAGLIFSLIRERSRAIERHDPTPVKPVLILSDWAGGLKNDIDSLFVYSLENSLSNFKETASRLEDLLAMPTFPQGQIPVIQGMIKSIHADHSALKEHLASGELFLEKVSSLCAVYGGIVLIFDQFEEVLRAGSKVKNEALELIKNIYRFEKRARLLISLRREYHTDLHPLEAYVGGLYTRTHFLKPMRVTTVREAVRNSARIGGVTVPDVVVNRIMEMLIESRKQAIEQDETLETPEDPESELDLLTLQAILKELYNDARALQPNKIVIDEDAFSKYINDRPLAEVVGKALERWIESSLKEASEKFQVNTAAGLEDIPSVKIDHIIRHIVTRMAPFLSSGGYKVPAEVHDLLFQTLRMDFSRLRPGLESHPEDWRVVQMDPPRMEWSRLGLNEEQSPDDVSGLAREKGWSPATTALHLFNLFFEALYRLKAANIIKSFQVGNGQVWELVHDRLGKPLSHWAETQRETWDDCVNSLTPCKGVDMVVDSASATEKIVSNSNWRGCVVTPREDLTFNNYEFINCDLSGTFFKNCIFRGVRFDYCNLSGVIFVNCRFEPGTEGRFVQFIDSFADGLTFFSVRTPAGKKSEFGSVSFEKCLLNHLKLTGAVLSGNVEFKNKTSLYMSEFTRLTPAKGKSPRLQFSKGCTLNYCAWDINTQGMMDWLGAVPIGSGVVKLEVKR